MFFFKCCESWEEKVWFEDGGVVRFFGEKGFKLWLGGEVFLDKGISWLMV